MFPKQIIYFVFFSILPSVMGAWMIARFGHLAGLTDHPNQRSSHSHITPKGGGIGILITFYILSYMYSLHWSLWITAGFISLLSFWGDKIDINPKIRLLLQVIFSAVFIFYINISKFISFFDTQNKVYTIVCFLSVLIVLIIFQVGTANFYNFMDGINGIAAINGIIAFSSIGFVAQTFHNQMNISYLAIGIAIACFAFLPFNFPRAKVFLGDVGSVLLGFLFAGLMIIIAENVKDLLCYSGFLFLFYADEITTMLERIKDKQSLISPHRRHLYQILVNEREIEHWKVTTIYGFAQILISILMIYLRNASMLIICITLIILYFGFSIISNKFKSGVGS